MRKTERHLKLIRWINGHSGVTLQQIANWLGTDYSTAARLVRKMIKAGLLRRIEALVLTSQPIIATRKGCKLTADCLPPLKGIRAGTWRHDSLLVSLERKIVEYFGGIFQPERRIRCNRKIRNLPAGHVPDAVIERAGRRDIAFELELSKKTPVRLQKIIDEYATSGAYERVFYLTDDKSIARFIKRFTHGLDFIQINIVREPTKPKTQGDLP
jgi:DNA-binding MarR family transcriptional regulator